MSNELIKPNEDHVIIDVFSFRPSEDVAKSQVSELKKTIGFFMQGPNFAFLKDLVLPVGFLVINQPEEVKINRWFGRPPKVEKQDRWVLCLRFDRKLTEEERTLWKMFALGYTFARDHRNGWFYGS